MGVLYHAFHLSLVLTVCVALAVSMSLVFLDFTLVTVSLVVQMELSSLKVVCRGQVNFRWTLDRQKHP